MRSCRFFYARGKVMFKILMKWEELKAYFTSAELAQSQLRIYRDILNKLH